MAARSPLAGYGGSRDRVKAGRGGGTGGGTQDPGG